MLIRTILCPTDFSEQSEFACRLACALARDYGARIIVTHVAEPPVPIYGNGLVLPPPQTVKGPLLAKLHEFLRCDSKIQIEHCLVEGDAATEILRVAGETKCDLIVIGTHGRTGVRRLLLGSVAEQVVRKAPCPVLTTTVPTRRASSSDELGTTAASERPKVMT